MRTFLRVLALPFAVLAYAVTWLVLVVGLLIVAGRIVLFGRGCK